MPTPTSPATVSSPSSATFAGSSSQHPQQLQQQASPHRNYHGISRTDRKNAAQRACILVVRPQVDRSCEDASKDPAVRRRLKVGTDPTLVPPPGDFTVRRITQKEADECFSEAHLRSKHKARGASKKLIELLAAGTDIPKGRAHHHTQHHLASDGVADMPLSPSRLPTSLLELARYTKAAEEQMLMQQEQEKQAAAAKESKDHNKKVVPSDETEDDALAERSRLGRRKSADAAVASPMASMRSSNNANQRPPAPIGGDLSGGSSSNNNSGPIATAMKLTAALEASLAEYDRPTAGMIAVRCAPTSNKNFFRESYAHDYHVVAATNLCAAPAACINAPCRAVEKSVLEMYKNHLLLHCKCLWDGEDTSVVLQTPHDAGSLGSDQQHIHHSSASGGAGMSRAAASAPVNTSSATTHQQQQQQHNNNNAIPNAPSQIIATMLFPEVPNQKEEQQPLSGFMRRPSTLSRRPSMRLHRADSFNGDPVHHPHLLQRRPSVSGATPQRQATTCDDSGSGQTSDALPLEPTHPHEKHLLRYVLEDLLEERLQRKFAGIYVDVFVSAVIVEEPEAIPADGGDGLGGGGVGGGRRDTVTSVLSGISGTGSKKDGKDGGANKIQVEDLLSGHPKTSRYIGDWSGGVKDLEAVQAAAQQMQALADAPSVEKMREECKVLQMLKALDESDAEKLIEEFKKFDQDGNGVLDPQEIREFFMEAFGYWIVDEELDLFFKVVDQDGSGTIDIPEFLALFEGQRPKKGPGENRSLKPPNAKLVEGLKALARIKRVKKADELIVRRPVIAATPSGKPSSSAPSGGGSGRQPESKILQMLHALDDHDAEKLISEFKKFDADGNSELDRTEVREFFMEAFSYWVTEEELDQFFKIADTDNSGTIDIPEFLALFEQKRDKRAFTGRSLPPGVSAVSSQIKSGLDALARIKRVRGNVAALKGAAAAVGKSHRGRSSSLTSLTGDMARRPKDLLAGPKLAYRHTNSTNPYDVGVFNMRMLHVNGPDDIEWLERRLATCYQKAYSPNVFGLSSDTDPSPFSSSSPASSSSTGRCKGHWLINVTLRQAYDETSGIGLPSRSGTMRFFLMNASPKRMSQLNFELRRIIHLPPRTIYDKFPPDVDAQLQMDSTDARGRLKKSVLSMVHLLRATLHQRKISRLLSFVVATEQQANASLAILGNLMRIGIETTNLAYDEAVEDALIHLVALRIQLEKERNDAHFAVESFDEIKKAKLAANKDIRIELEKQINGVYRQLRRMEVATEDQARLMMEAESVRRSSSPVGQQSSYDLLAGTAFPGGTAALEALTAEGLTRKRSILFLESTSSPRCSRRTAPGERSVAAAAAAAREPSVTFDAPTLAGIDSLSGSSSFAPASLSATGALQPPTPSNREIALTTAVIYERDKAEKASLLRQQQLHDVQLVYERAKERYARALRSVSLCRTEFPRKQAHYEFLLANSQAEWKEEEQRMESTRKEQLVTWTRANVEQRDAQFAISVIADVPSQDGVLESVNRQAAVQRQRSFEQQLQKCDALARHHQAHLKLQKQRLVEIQRVADTISGRSHNSDAAAAWEDDDNQDDVDAADDALRLGGGDHGDEGQRGATKKNQQQQQQQQQLSSRPDNKNNIADPGSLGDDGNDDSSFEPQPSPPASAGMNKTPTKGGNHNQHRSVGAASAFGAGAKNNNNNSNNNNNQLQQHLLGKNIQHLDYANRRKLIGHTALLFETASLLFRVEEACRTQNPEMEQKFARGDFHEADIREANRTLTVQPPQVLLATMLKSPPTVLQTVFRDALNGAHAALNSLGSTFGRNAALFHADSLKTGSGQHDLASAPSATVGGGAGGAGGCGSTMMSVSVAPLELSLAMQQSLQLAAQVRNDPRAKIGLTPEDAERLERLTFALASVDDERRERDKKDLDKAKSVRRGYGSQRTAAAMAGGFGLGSVVAVGSGGRVGGVSAAMGTLLTPRRPATARISSGKLTSTLKPQPSAVLTPRGTAAASNAASSFGGGASAAKHVHSSGWK